MLPDVFRKFAESKPEWAGCRGASACSRTQGMDRSGGKLAFRERAEQAQQRTNYRIVLRTATPSTFTGCGTKPVNEQGVVLLFGMLAKELGYVIEAVQTGFPTARPSADCSGRWPARAHRI